MISLTKQLELLRKEYEYEQKEFQRETETFGIDRKVKRGDCWFPITLGRSFYNSLDRLSLEVYRTADNDIEHNFEHGKTVTFFSKDASDKLTYVTFSATVNRATENSVTVSLPNEKALYELQNDGVWGMQINFDETTYKLMFEALKKVISAKDGRLAELRDITQSNRRKALFGSVSKSSFPWLNNSQQKAVQKAVAAKDFMIVHGPPGTGKSTTLAEAVVETLRREPQVIVAAQSNTAVDRLCQLLTERGVDVLRIGNPKRVTEEMLVNTYEYRFEQHNEYSSLWALRNEIRQMRGRDRRKRTPDFYEKMDKLRERADNIEMRIRNDIFQSCRVVACTLAGSANQVLRGENFNTLFIDEAGQALEAACWIAIQKANRFVLAGDHHQLPPTIKSGAARYGGLEETLMEKLASIHPEAVEMLNVQYRMNRELARFSSDWFYEGKLMTAGEIEHRSALDELERSIIWVNTESEMAEEEFVGDTFGRINKYEAEETIKTIKEFADRYSRERMVEEHISIGVISPYRAQIQYLRKLIKSSLYLKPIKNLISVNTVDAFQGQERDIIIVSLVRSNKNHDIGFLKDYRRMNVAITRARSKLYIIGNRDTLTTYPFYKKLYEYASE